MIAKILQELEQLRRAADRFAVHDQLRKVGMKYKAFIFVG